MKKVMFLLMSIVALSSFISFHPVEKKEFTVSFTLEEWQAKIDVIEYTKNLLKQTNAPANVVFPLTDSLNKLQLGFVNQIRPQMDTTSKTKK